MVSGIKVSPHLYWRVLFTNTPGAPRARNISRLQMHTVVNGVNVCITGNGQVSALTEAKPIKTLTFVAHNAVNNNPLTDWMSVKITNFDWIKWTFNTPRLIKELQLTASNNSRYVGNAPQDFHLQWSDDNVTWTTAFTVTGEINWQSGEHRRYSKETITTTIGQTYSNIGYSASAIVPFTDHLLAIETEIALPLLLSINRNNIIGTAADKETALQLGKISSQYIPIGQAKEHNHPLSVIVRAPVLSIIPAVETTTALLITPYQKYPNPTYSYAHPVWPVNKYPVVEAASKEEVFKVEIRRTYPLPVALDNESARSIVRGNTNIKVGIGATHEEASQIREDKNPLFLIAESLAAANQLKYFRNLVLRTAIESNTALIIEAARSVSFVSAIEKNTAATVKAIGGVFVGEAFTNNSAISITIHRSKTVNQVVEKDSGLSAKGSLSFSCGQAGSMSSASSFSHITRGVQLGVAISLSSGMHVIGPPKILHPGVAAEEDMAINISHCPVYEADSAHPIERIYPGLIKTATEGDSTNWVRSVIFNILGNAVETDTSLGNGLGISSFLGRAHEHDNLDRTWIAPVKGDHNAIKALGNMLEGDIAQLYGKLCKALLYPAIEKPNGASIVPLRITPIGQAASKDEAHELPDDRYIPIGIAYDDSFASWVRVQVSDKFNQAIESSVANYVNAVKSKALQLIEEHDTATAISKILRNKGIGIASEQDIALKIRTAFAHDFDQAVEKEAALRMEHERSIILGVAANDGGFAYTLDRFLKAHNLVPVVEQDVALVPTVNLTKELKQAFEYDDALKNNAARVKFLRTVATNEVAHALGQTMKHQLIKMAVSSSDAPFLHGEQPWRNKWQATVSIQQDIEFSVPIQNDFESVVSLQQDVEFIVAIQESKQLVEEI